LDHLHFRSDLAHRHYADPANPSHLWIVDSGTDRVSQSANAGGLSSGSQAASPSVARAAGNTYPQGIADPPVMGEAAPITNVTIVPASDGVLLATLDGPGWRQPGLAKTERASSDDSSSRRAAEVWIDAALAAVIELPPSAKPAAVSESSPRKAHTEASDGDWESDVDALMALAD
jgi:hypothetical protein